MKQRFDFSQLSESQAQARYHELMTMKRPPLDEMDALGAFMRSKDWKKKQNGNGNGVGEKVGGRVGGSVATPTDPPPVPRSIQRIPVFPKEVAFESGFASYWHAFGDKNEVCPGYHFASALAQVSQALGRKFMVKGRTGSHYPNWYQCLVGTSFIASKSFIAEETSEAITAMFEVDEDSCNRHRQISKFSTPEGLADDLSTHDEKGNQLDWFDGLNGVRGFAWIDEMRSLFVKAKQTASEGVIAELTKVYKCSNRPFGGGVRGNKTRADRYALNIFGCTTLDWFEESVTISDIAGGFINRFVFYLHEQQPLFPFMEQPDPVQVNAWQELLKDIEKESLKNHTQQFDLDTECETEYSDWYIKTKTAVIDDPNNLEVIAGARIVESTMKLALIYAIFDNAKGDNRIHKESFERAKAVATYWAEVTKHMFSNLAVDKTDKLEKTILDKLAEMDNSAKWSELRRRLSGRTNTNDFNRAIESLVIGEEITVTDGRPKMIIRSRES